MNISDLKFSRQTQSSQKGRIEVRRRLKHIATTQRETSEANVSGFCVVVARTLTFLTLLLLAVMPFTEHFWIFDNFCRGGQDFEFSLLAIAMALGLVLLLSLHHKQGLTVVLLVQQWLSVILRDTKSTGNSTAQLLSDGYAILARSLTPTSKFELPLLI
jgi:hypothetical protein